jgi:hypothetical protein
MYPATVTCSGTNIRIRTYSHDVSLLLYNVRFRIVFRVYSLRKRTSAHVQRLHTFLRRCYCVLIGIWLVLERGFRRMKLHVASALQWKRKATIVFWPWYNCLFLLKLYRLKCTLAATTPEISTRSRDDQVFCFDRSFGLMRGCDRSGWTWSTAGWWWSGCENCTQYLY